MSATKLETDTVTVYCVGSHKMALYAKDNGNAWVSSTQALNVREYR